MDETRKQEECLLAERASQGDGKAFEQLFTRNLKLIMYEVRKRLFSRESKDAEDVVQDVVLGMYSHIRNLRNPEAFRSWMYRIIFVTCASHNRMAGRKRENIDNHADTLVDDSREARPSGIAEANERNAHIRTMIGQLPEKQRQALFMYYYADMSYEEIAEAFGVSVGTVGSNITRAKANLKKRMKKSKAFSEERWEQADTLGGMALGPAILSALETDVDATITAPQVDAMAKLCCARLSDFAAAGTGSACAGPAIVKAGVGGFRLALILTAVSAVVIPATVFGFDVISDMGDVARRDASPPITEETEPYMPDVEIRLSGEEGLPGKINPSRAVLIVDDGTSILWRIMNGDGVTFASGTDEAIEKDAFALSPGAYAIEWIIENETGKQAIARREFEIVEHPEQLRTAGGPENAAASSASSL
ncbi:MAG: sigma-70 family RNA polymerase sigma factor [Clostridiales Family XIII bacterium]|jgi:RNA polymerase sigma-70 factor (ECF subfamily)|nr:sigma-70 family RNA polymerase sigma factor [Clostridiales Family XIII bacterium]